MRRSLLVLGFLGLTCLCANGQETLAQTRQDQCFQTGVDLLSHHEFGAAYNAFGEFLATQMANDPRRAAAEYYHAYCALILLHADGEKQMESFILAHPFNAKTANAYFELACFFYAEKDYAKASGYFSKVGFPTLSNEEQTLGRFRWGYSLFTQRNFLAALDQFNVVKASGGAYGPASSYYAGFIESAAGDYDNALIDLKRAEVNESYASIVPVLITHLYYKQGNDMELIKYAEAALKRDNISSSEELTLLIAEAFFRQNDYQKALPGFSEYLEANENASRPVLYRAGYSAYALGKYDEALPWLKASASDVDSIGMFASYFLGAVYLGRQEKPLALTAFETAKKFKKDRHLTEESYFLSAKINYDMGRPDMAIQEFEWILKEFPQSTHNQEIRELLSQAYVNANNYNKAIEYIESLERRPPIIDQAYQKATFLKGSELFNKEEFPLAVVFFQKSLEYPIDGGLVADAAFWCAETFSLGRKYEQAIPLYEKALGHASAKPDVFRQARYGLGYAQFNLKQYDRAIASFRDFVARSSAEEPNYTDGTLRLADCNYVLKSYGEAISLYRKTLQLGSVDSDYAHLQIGIILSIQHKYGEASSEFEVVARNKSSRYSDEALFQLGQISFEQSNYPSAIIHFTTVIDGSKSPRLVPFALSRRAAAYYNLKDYEHTSNDYITVLEKFQTLRTCWQA